MIFRQPLRGAAEALFAYAEGMPVIDTHEHVPRSEKDYNSETIRFGQLFNPYISNDLVSAGMRFPRDEWAAFVCIEDDWDAFAPYWNAVKLGSYARPLRMALERFYGEDDFTRENHLDLVRRINEANTPGIYQRIFREACGIERAICCAGGLPAKDDPILRGIIVSPSFQVESKEGIEKMVERVGASAVKTLDDLVAVSDAYMENQAKAGAIGFKTTTIPVEMPDRDRAEEALQGLLAGQEMPAGAHDHLKAHIREEVARKAVALGLPVAVHTGVWGDFRMLNIQHLIGFLGRHPDARMDLYHLGIPDVRSAVQIVKNFPNAHMNLCWAHVVAPDMVVRTLKEAIDMVPLNKVFAFGADYVLFIEKVYGHLLMAKENVAIALGDRVDRDLMGMDEAKQVLRGWFYENPKAFYGL